MKIIFFGTPEFAVASLDALLKEGYEVAAVVTTPDRTGGRGNKLIESDVKKYALQNGLRILQPEKLRDPQFIRTLEEIGADLFVVIAFRMLPEVVWRLPPLGTFNLHASLLPQLRGAAPINHAIMSGFKKTGVTTFLINAEIDKGGILLSQEVEIDDEDNAGSLHDKLMEVGAHLVIDTVKGLEKGNLIPSPQPAEDYFTPAPKIFKSDCELDFEAPSSVICRKIRGLSPYPGAWAMLALSDGRQLEVKVLQAKLSDRKSEESPGNCIIRNKSFYVATPDSDIEILSLQPAGKKPMDGKAFLAGYTPSKFIKSEKEQ